MFLNIGLTVLMNNFFSRIDGKLVARLLILVFAAVSVFFYKSIGFHLPMAEATSGYTCVYFTIAILLLLLLFSALAVKYPKTINCLIAGLLIPVCLISTQEIRFYDAAYIFSPALRILHGFKPFETYFQYDYLLSLLAAAWMKMHLAINLFKVPLQLSYYGLLLGIYLFAQKFFSDKRYALYLLVSLVIVKIYGNIYDPIAMVQVTPLRLDLWFIVLVLAYFKGASHWLVGLSLGFLVIVHHNFGMIYTASYLSLMVILFIFDAAEEKIGVKKLIRKYALSYALNISILLASLFCYGIFFGPKAGSSSFNFQKIGLGFLPIMRNSFYWYIAVILGLTFLMIANSRKHISRRAFETGIFLIMLAIGNSLYFFGRSHENNIINIAAVWLFCLFLMFCLMDLPIWSKRTSVVKRAIVPAAALLVVLIFAYCYSGRAIDRIALQYANLRNGHFVDKDGDIDVGCLKRLTMSDKRVIFLTEADFYYYYRGGYIPQDYYAAIYARVFKKNTVDYLNSRLAEGYYLVIPKMGSYFFKELSDMLEFKNRKDGPDFTVISNNPIG